MDSDLAWVNGKSASLDKSGWVFVDGGLNGAISSLFKFGDDRLRGLASAEGQILPFAIDFDGRPYNTHTTVRACGGKWQNLTSGQPTLNR